MTAINHDNIALHLQKAAAENPDNLAVAIQKSGGKGYHELTLADLNGQSDRLAAGLTEYGIGKGVRTVLMVKPSLQFFALVFGIFKTGAIPVIVDPGMGLSNLKTCLAEAEPEAFIGIPQAHIARLILGWGKPTVNKLVTVGPKFFWGGKRLIEIIKPGSGAFTIPQNTADDTAAILFTSGSTGIPKGARYTHQMFNTQVEILRKDYAIEPGEKDVSTFPLFALFGPALGMASIVPDMDMSKPGSANPAHIINAAQDYEATNMFCSPALIEKVGRHGQPEALASLKRVITAGAPARPDALQRFQSLLADGVDILNSYGATESLPVSYIGSKELLEQTADKTASGAGVCVGKPVAEAEVKIIRIDDNPISKWSDDLIMPQGEIGEITVKGTMVSPEYFNRPDSTAQAKIKDGDSFYHRMGDTGYFDEDGNIWMCGRKGHRVVLDDETLFTVPCERIFDNHPNVYRTALVAVITDEGTIPVLCVEPEKTVSAGQHALIENELLMTAEKHAITQKIKTILFHSSFPVDVRHNAKIFREQLTDWAQKKVVSK